MKLPADSMLLAYGIYCRARTPYSIEQHRNICVFICNTLQKINYYRRETSRVINNELETLSKYTKTQTLYIQFILKIILVSGLYNYPNFMMIQGLYYVLMVLFMFSRPIKMFQVNINLGTAHYPTLNYHQVL